MRVVVQQRASRRRVAVARGLWTSAEVTVSLGLVVLLFVVHQLWWTNREARQDAAHQVQALERQWDHGGGAPPAPAPSSGTATGTGGTRDGAGSSRPGTGGSTTRQAARTSAPAWDKAYAVIRIPRIGITAPIAQGVSKANVLNKGYVGHYVDTAGPGQAGNFALAGHRNTHGEPFRYINRLHHGDTVTVETKDALYTYVVDKGLPQTSARDSGVIAPVPRSTVRPQYGYSNPGHYLTLTTCTPEYTSRYRLAIWATLRSVRPR
ncbi:class E sortase [Streptomyces sp. NBC_01267]|uniref:class E sortase n=1 Tax=unclassified Streptomyces TaxID=2593676 RepID=UPI002DDAEF33|nr:MULTISPECIES: class E sortase [unclassified Streptomyces]WSC24735.1 class E sortase [Streptomyces sp. NBC_01766]WSV58711.1 class E sortase [Streptomyces sp. NBC_01014]